MKVENKVKVSNKDLEKKKKKCNKIKNLLERRQKREDSRWIFGP